MSEHTPIPWYEDAGHIYGGRDGFHVCDPRCEPAEFAEEMDANTALILRAVNSHTALLEAFEAIERADLAGEIQHRSDHVAKLHYMNALAAVRAAIALAKETP